MLVKQGHLKAAPDGSIRDSPSKDYPAHPGHWTVDWMKPEPMHAIEVVENYDTGKHPRCFVLRSNFHHKQREATRFWLRLQETYDVTR